VPESLRWQTCHTRSQRPSLHLAKNTSGVWGQRPQLVDRASGRNTAL